MGIFHKDKGLVITKIEQGTAKPCPFCGNIIDLEMHDYGDEKNLLYCVHCNNCHADGPSMNNPEAALKAWNYNPNTAALREGYIKNVLEIVQELEGEIAETERNGYTKLSSKIYNINKKQAEIVATLLNSNFNIECKYHEIFLADNSFYFSIELKDY